VPGRPLVVAYFHMLEFITYAAYRLEEALKRPVRETEIYDVMYLKPKYYGIPLFSEEDEWRTYLEYAVKAGYLFRVDGYYAVTDKGKEAVKGIAERSKCLSSFRQFLLSRIDEILRDYLQVRGCRFD